MNKYIITTPLSVEEVTKMVDWGKIDAVHEYQEPENLNQRLNQLEKLITMLQQVDKNLEAIIFSNQASTATSIRALEELIKDKQWKQEEN